MRTHTWQGLRRLAYAAAGVVLGLGLGLSPAWAAGVDTPPPSPIQIGERKPVVTLELPAKPIEPGAVKAPEPAEKAAPAKPPKKEWKVLAPKDVVSAKSMLFLTIPDFSKAAHAFPRSALAGLLGEEEVGRPLADILKRVRQTYVEGDGTLADAEVRRRTAELGLIEKLYGVLEGAVAVAVEAPNLKEAAGGVGLPRFLVVIGMSNEKRQEAIASALETFSSGQLQDPRFRDETAKVGAYEVRQLRGEGLEVYESWAFVENLFLYGWGKGIVEEAVTAYAAQGGQGTLALDRGYELAFSRVGVDALFYAQFDGAELLKQALTGDPMLATALRPIIEGFGTNRPQLAAGIQVAAGEKEAPLKEKLLVLLTKAALPQVTTSCQAVTRALASSDVLYYGAQQGSAEAVLRAVFAESADPTKPTVFQKALPALARALKQDDKDQALKMFAPFQGEMAMIVDYVPGETFRKDWQEVFQVVFAVEVNRSDRANAEAVLKLLREATQVPYRQTPFHGTEIFFQAGAAPEQQGKEREVRPLLSPAPVVPGETPSEGTPFFVSYAIHNLGSPDQPRLFLLLSDNLKALKKAIQQSGAPKHALNEREDFRHMLGAFDEGRYSVNYLDLPGLVSALYRQLIPELVKIGVFSREFLTELPPDMVMLRHLIPMGWASTVREEGLQTEVISPAGNLPLIGLVGALAWPAYNAQQQRQIASQVKENLKQIGLGLQLYAAVFDRFPGKLSDLFPEYVTDLRVFRSPFNPNAVNGAEDIDDWQKTNLVYVPGRSFQDLSQDLLIYEVRPTLMQATEDKGYRLLHQGVQLNGAVTAYPLSRMKLLLGATAGPLAGPKAEKERQP